MSSRGIHRCEPCHYRGVNTSSVKYCKSCNEFLCKDCADFHKSFKATRDHFLTLSKDKDDVKQYRKMFDISACKQHTNKITEFYCIEHSAMLCSFCLLKSAQHSKCADKIVEIQSLGKSLIGSQFAETLREDFHRVISSSQHAIEEVKKAREETKNTVKTFKHQIEALRAKILAAFDGQTEQIIQKATETNEKIENKYTKTIESFDKLRKSAMENEKLVKSVIESGCAEDVFKCIFSTVKQLEDFKVIIEKLDNDNHKVQLVVVEGDLLKSLLENDEPIFDYKIKKTKVRWFTPFQNKVSKGEFKNQIGAFHSSSTGIGERALGQSSSHDKGRESSPHTESKNDNIAIVEIDTNIKTEYGEFLSTVGHKKIAILPESSTTSSEDVHAKGSKDESKTIKQRKGETELSDQELLAVNHEIELSHSFSFDVPSLHKNVPWVGGIAVLKNSNIIVSDSINSNLILLNEDSQIVTVKTLRYEPGQVTLLKDDCLAVCLKRTNQILLLNVQGDKIKEKRYVQTRYHPKCIQSVYDNMLVSCQDGAGGWYLYILTTEGDICSTFKDKIKIYDGHKICVQALTTGNGNFRIIQCCEITNRLQCFEPDGSFVFGFKVYNVSSVATDLDGYIYVVRFSGECQVYSPNGDYLLRLYSKEMYKAKLSAVSH